MSPDEAVLAAGDTELRLRSPGAVPRGGLHSDYALTIPEREYDDWYDRLDERFDLVEHTFGDARSLNFDDPQGTVWNSVSGRSTALASPACSNRPRSRGVVWRWSLHHARVRTGRRRPRRRPGRLSTGDLDLELWSPRLGIADARGGVHVDFGVVADDPIDGKGSR